MPILDCFNADGSLGDEADLYLATLMLVPAGRESPDWDIVAAALMLNRWPDAGDMFSPALHARLYELGKPAMDAKIARCRKWGELAGNTLLITLTIHREEPSKASRSKAERMLGDHLKGRTTDRDIPTSPNKLADRWHEYRAVAPLWAAFRRLVIKQDAWERRRPNRLRAYAAMVAMGLEMPLGDLGLWIALAEHYRRFAEGHHRPVGQSGSVRATHEAPLIAAGVAWQAPPHALLPEIGPEAMYVTPGRGFRRALSRTPARPPRQRNE